MVFYFSFFPLSSIHVNLKSMLLTSSFIAKTLCLPATKGLNLIFSEIQTDSRKRVKNSLFLALKGENFDGHDFIDQAIKQGATGIICRKDFSVPLPSPLFVLRVENTLQAYQRLSQAWRSQFKIPVIAIGGSFGKTTTKEFLGAILQGRWASVLKTEGSQNGFVGIPMTLLKLRDFHQAAVIEIGIDEVGAMQQHVTQVAPTLALLTGIGPEHLENLKTVSRVAQEEGILFTTVAQAGGTCAINLDDPWIAALPSFKEGRRIFYSLHGNHSKNNELFLRGEWDQPSGTLKLSGPGLESFSVSPPLPGVHNARNLLGAITVAQGLGLTPQEIITGLQKFKGAEGRSEVRELPNGLKVLCDYYNASPPSTEVALDLLQQLGRSTRWACLGDMLELGPQEESFHRSLAKKIISLSLDGVLLYGSRMKFLFDELQKSGFTGRFAHFTSPQALTETLFQYVKSEDVVLIKGSRGMKMETLWNQLQKKYSQ
jgi:UDP-N-acetylmuramoyl-tripeptide--D-alanyl-D-alanine ligase